MMELLELAPRQVDEVISEADVEFLQTLDASALDQGRCPVTIPRITWGMGCS